MLTFIITNPPRSRGFLKKGLPSSLNYFEARISEYRFVTLSTAVCFVGEFNYHVRGHPLLMRPFAKTKPPHPAPVLRGCSGNRVQIF